MKPADHIARAADEFQKGRVRYWAKPEAGRKLGSFHNSLCKAARRREFWQWRFMRDNQTIMIVPYLKGK